MHVDQLDTRPADEFYNLTEVFASFVLNNTGGSVRMTSRCAPDTIKPQHINVFNRQDFTLSYN